MSINKSAIVNILDYQGNSIGTGFFASSDGYIITCFHVLDYSGFLIEDRVRFSIGEDSQVFTAIWIDGDKEFDIALLESQINTNDYYSLNSFCDESMRASVSGYPRNVHSLISTRVTIDGIINSYKLQLGEANALTYGFSGAPIIANDVAIGMVQSFTEIDDNGRMAEIAFGIASKIIIEKYKRYISTNDLCLGYGEKVGKCKNYPVQNNLCMECFSNQYLNDIQALFEAQNYIIHKHTGFFVVELVYGSTSYFDMIVPIIKFNDKITQNDLYPIDDYKRRINVVITRTRLITNTEVSNECIGFIERNHIEVQSKESLLRFLFNLDTYRNDLAKFAHSKQLLNHYIEIYSKYPYSEDHDNGIRMLCDEIDSNELEEKESYSFDYNDYSIENDLDDKEYLKEYVSQFLQSDNIALLILGEYGSGKSSFCYNFALELLDYYQKYGQPNYFPIMIKLRGYNKATGLNESITNYFVNDLGVTNFNIHSLKMLLKNLNVVLILDGFDEIAKKADYNIKSEVLKDISEFVEKQTKVILTCRPNYFQNAEEYERLFDDTNIYYEPGDKPPLRFIETTIAELTPYQVVKYICTYENELNNRNITYKDIIKAIEKTHDLTDLSKRPFLLYMILRTLPDILDDVQRNPSTKINAAKLYEQYTDNWIKREERKNKTLIKSRDKELFCKELAFELYLSDSLCLSYRQFPDTIKSYFLNTVHGEDIDYFSHDIQSCSFLTSDRTGDFQFIHKSFMEYFVADRVVSKLMICLDKEWDIKEINLVLGRVLLSMEICLFIRDLFDLKNIDINILQQLLLSVKSHNTANSETILNLLSILSKVIPNIGQAIEQCGITDLSKVDLSFSKFLDSNLSFYSFEESHFYNTTFENMKFYHCDFSKAVFERITMKNAYFESCVFCNSTWKDSSLEHVIFGENDPYGIADEYTDISKSNWKNIVIKKCKLNNCDLTENKMINASIHESKFINVDFSSISLNLSFDSGNNECINCIGLPYEMQ